MAGCSLFGVRSSIETPAYTVRETLADGTEIRDYPARVAAEVAMPGGGAMARGRAFRTLFNYITGANEGSRRVAMTTPVETAAGGGARVAMTAPVETTGGGRAGEETMRFFLPASFSLESAPRPSDARVRLVEAPARTMAVRRFAGLRGRPMVDRQAARLRQAVADGPWRPVGAVVAWFYDPPSTLPSFRRNEVAVTVEPPNAVR
jgi:hypothetical protein